MSDWGTALKELLGGWNAVRRIDTEGFDWREQAKQQELARQQQQQQWQQGNEDWATKGAAEALVGGAPETEIPSMIEPTVNAGRVLARARGAGLQARSNIEAGKQASAEYIANQRFEAQKEMLRNTREFQQAMQRERLLAAKEGRQANEDAVFRRLKYELDYRTAHPSMGGGTYRPFVSPTGELMGFFGTRPGPEGQIPTLPLPPGMEGARTAPLPAAAQESQARGVTALATIANIENMLAKKPQGEEWTGPMRKLEYRTRSGQGIPGFVGDVLGVEPPSGEQALFSTEIAQLGNRAIQDITGAQVGQHEVPRLFTEIPTLEDRGEVLLAKLAVTKYRLGLLDAVRRGQITRDEAIQQINDVSSQNVLEQYRQRGLSSTPAPSGAGGRYIKKPRG